MIPATKPPGYKCEHLCYASRKGMSCDDLATHMARVTTGPADDIDIPMCLSCAKAALNNPRWYSIKMLPAYSAWLLANEQWQEHLERQKEVTAPKLFVVED